MVNSIRKNLSYEDIVSSIRLTMNHPLNKNINFVIVEGPDDSKFISFFLDEKVQVFESFSGKKGVLDIVKFFKKKNVIGICDKDYDDDSPQNIFFYDYCNLEIMLINEDNVIKKIISEKDNDFESPSCFRKKILESLKVISLLRKYNFSNLDTANRVKFGNGVVDNSYDYTAKKIELSKLEDYLKSINREKDLSWMSVALNDSTEYELRDITNGHDATKIISLLLGIRHDILCIVLRCAFSREHFLKTKLYNQLFTFQMDNELNYLSV